jgi:hypothetical chaperone protein
VHGNDGAARGFAAIDFGTSNSGVALPAPVGVRLVEVEAGFPTMPTAVFFRADRADGAPLYGRAAIAAYVEGIDGRLMRSMKSILGSDLLQRSTEIAPGHNVRYADVVSGYLRHLRRAAERSAGVQLPRVVLGRPVRFVDDDPARDAQAQAALEQAARDAGFREVRFQYEPIAAALDHEQRAAREQTVLVADIGGGTSDFSIVRIGPGRAGRADRSSDILANHGVHVAGTDFDRRIELASILPLLGYGSRRPALPGDSAREVPSAIYFDLATWHLINTVYAPARVAEVRRLRSWYAEPRFHRRLMAVLERRLGHALAAAAEQAKIDAAEQRGTRIDLARVEAGLSAALSETQAAAAIDADLERIVAAAAETARRSGLPPERIEVIYFTGGSTGLAALVQRIAACFPLAAVERGDRFASVATGLGVFARSVYGPG